MERPEADGAPAEVEQTDFSFEPTMGDILTQAGEVQKVVHERRSSGAENLLTIVTSQRERLRSRVQQLEQQNAEQREQIVHLQSDLERSKADNVKLYGKIKFLQSYQSQKHGVQTVDINSDETENRYSTEYESRLDPFRNFTMQEKQRKYAQLRTYDKATLGLTSWIMSSAKTRAIFFFYLLFLHVLVFLVLYRVAYTESCKRDFQTQCVEKFREHMHSVHGDANFNG